MGIKREGRILMFMPVKSKFMKSILYFILLFVFSLGFPSMLLAKDIYVDNLRGSDEGPGTERAPFKTILRAIKAMEGSDVLHFVPTGKPYRPSDPNEFRYLPDGSLEEPTIVDGHGIVLSGLRRYPLKDWTDEGDGIFSMYLKNNYHNYDPEVEYWRGFDLVFFDGKAGENCKSHNELVPYGYFLYTCPKRDKAGKQSKFFNMLYIKLPAGQTPDSVCAETVSMTCGMQIIGNYKLIKNITCKYFSSDDFAVGPGVGFAFDNVRGCYSMDQGISHHGAHSVVTNSRFDHNAGGGIVDVAFSKAASKVKYVNCIVEDDEYRGGIEFRGHGDLIGEFEMENCIIRNNLRSQLFLYASNVKLTNCIIIGPESKNVEGIVVNGGSLTLINCTFYRFEKLLAIWDIGPNPENKIKIFQCAFIDCNQSYHWFKRSGITTANIDFDYNFYDHTTIYANDVKYSPADWQNWINATGMDKHSSVEKYQGVLPPYSLPSLKNKGKDGGRIGANIKPNMKTGLYKE